MDTLTQGGETGPIISSTTTEPHLTTQVITMDTTHVHEMTTQPNVYEMTTDPNTSTEPTIFTDDHDEIKIKYIEQQPIQKEIKQTIILVGIICIFVYTLTQVN